MPLLALAGTAAVVRPLHHGPRLTLRLRRRARLTSSTL
jgi:hypothetical protein